MNNQGTAVQTELRYLTNADELSLTSSVMTVQVNGPEIKFTTAVSPFYAKAGGQRADIGSATSQSCMVKIDDFRFEDGIAYHIGHLQQGSLQPGDEILLQVDAQYRLQNSAYHTAGELIIACMKLLRFDVEILSAIHYGYQQSRIEFDLEVEQEFLDTLKDQLQRKINHLVFTGGIVQILTLQDRAEIIKQVGHFPDYVQDEFVRVVKVLPAVTGRPCKGTHVFDLKQLNRVTVDKLKTKSHKLIISYSVEIP